MTKPSSLLLLLDRNTDASPVWFSIVSPTEAPATEKIATLPFPSTMAGSHEGPTVVAGPSHESRDDGLDGFIAAHSGSVDVATQSVLGVCVTDASDALNQV